MWAIARLAGSALIHQTVRGVQSASESSYPLHRLPRHEPSGAGDGHSTHLDGLQNRFGRPDLSKSGGGNTAVSNQILTSTLKDAIGPR